MYRIKGTKIKIPHGTSVDSNNGRVIYPDDYTFNGTFKTNKECVTYLEEYNKHINESLQDHLNKKEKGASVLFIGCSERSKFISTNEQTI